MIAAVLDANVLASGIVGAQKQASTPGQLLQAWREERFTLVVSEHLLGELARALTDSYFRRRLTPEQIARAQFLLRTDAVLTPITATVRGIATHPEDDLVLATAASVQPVYLVTGDQQLQRLGFYQDVTILSPRAFLEVLTNEYGEGS